MQPDTPWSRVYQTGFFDPRNRAPRHTYHMSTILDRCIRRDRLLSINSSHPYNRTSRASRYPSRTRTNRHHVLRKGRVEVRLRISHPCNHTVRAPQGSCHKCTTLHRILRKGQVEVRLRTCHPRSLRYRARWCYHMCTYRHYRTPHRVVC